MAHHFVETSQHRETPFQRIGRIVNTK